MGQLKKQAARGLMKLYKEMVERAALRELSAEELDELTFCLVAIQKAATECLDGVEDENRTHT